MKIPQLAFLLVAIRSSYEGLAISGNCSSKLIGHKDQVEHSGSLIAERYQSLTHLPVLPGRGCWAR